MTAIGAALLGAVLDAIENVSEALADTAFWADLRCTIYCELTPNSDIDGTIQAAIGAAIRASDYTGTGYTASVVLGIIADYFEGLPIAVIRENAIIGAFASYDCSGCECPGDVCLTDGWTVEFGTEIERTCDYIKVQNQFNAPDSRYHCQIKSADLNTCAFIGIEYEVETSPSPVGNTCGVAWPNDLTESQPNINLCNGADATTGASGWIKFTLTV
jgi:hypothetical protein